MTKQEERFPAGTKVTYTGSDGQRYEATVADQSHDSPGGEWVSIRLPDGRTTTWARPGDLRPSE
jgi:hypothetical protein